MGGAAPASLSALIVIPPAIPDPPERNRPLYAAGRSPASTAVTLPDRDVWERVSRTTVEPIWTRAVILDGKEDKMILKTMLLAALGALSVAAPAAVQAQPRDSDSHQYYDSDGSQYYQARPHYHHRCGLIRRGEYGVFGRYRERWTLGCQ